MDGPRPAGSAEALALEAQGGSVQAFEQLVARFEAPLFHFLNVRTRDSCAAEDLVQESFLRAWQRIDRYDSRWRFSTWLYTVAERLCVSAHRARGHEPAREPAHEMNELASLARHADPSLLAGERDEGRALWELATRVLRPDERTALWLRYAEDLSMEEIGSVLERPAVTVRVLLFRARERLAAALGARPVASTAGAPARGASIAPLENGALAPKGPLAPEGLRGVQ